MLDCQRFFDRKSQCAYMIPDDIIRTREFLVLPCVESIGNLKFDKHVLFRSLRRFSGQSVYGET